MRRRFPVLSLAVVAAFSAAVACADEGMWTYDRFPAGKVEATYGFAPDAAWLDRLRLGSVRLDNACSAALVSPEGLVQTNHHCISDCVVNLSAEGFDPYFDSVMAETLTEERGCPGLNADVVMSISDVTEAVAGATAGLSGEAAVDARDDELTRIESGCRDDDAGRHCEVVMLYGGGVYALYGYRRYSDVRLVFAPEAAAAQFGGDPDNFNFPRYAFDVAFLRLYDNDAPAVTPSHLQWRSAPLAEGELVFVSGNPYETGRLWPTSMVSYVRNVYLPWSLVTGAELRGRLLAFAAEGEEQARTSFELLFAVENTYKSEWGELTALSSPGFFEALQAAEDDLRRRVEGEDLLPAGEGDPWEEIARAYENYRSFYYADRYLAEGATDSLLFGFARDIVRTAEERAKSEVDRLEGYSDADLPLIEDSLLADIPVDPALEELVLAFWLSKTREFLTTDDPLTKKLLGDESPEGLARRLVTGTRLADVDERRRLYEGGAEAVAASDDPMIAFARSFDAEARTLDRRWRNEVREVRIAGLERIAAARFAVHGDAVYPDATGTLRLNYGKVARWTEPSGREVDPFTYFSGLFGRATGAEPYRLSPLWEAAREKLSPDTIFNVSTDNDIVGGNSGSPLVDRDGNVVGAAFDGNIHSLGGFYLFEPARNRTVAVAATAIEEALVTVYGLQRIVDELRR